MDRRERLPGEFDLPPISSAGPAVSQSDACSKRYAARSKTNYNRECSHCLANIPLNGRSSPIAADKCLYLPFAAVPSNESTGRHSVRTGSRLQVAAATQRRRTRSSFR